MINIIKDQYLNDIDDIQDTEFPEPDDEPDDFRTDKEQREDMGDYLKDRDYDWKMSGEEWKNELPK